MNSCTKAQLNLLHWWQSHGEALMRVHSNKNRGDLVYRTGWKGGRTSLKPSVFIALTARLATFPLALRGPIMSIARTPLLASFRQRWYLYGAALGAIFAAFPCALRQPIMIVSCAPLFASCWSLHGFAHIAILTAFPCALRGPLVTVTSAPLFAPCWHLNGFALLARLATFPCALRGPIMRVSCTPLFASSDCRCSAGISNRSRTYRSGGSGRKSRATDEVSACFKHVGRELGNIKFAHIPPTKVFDPQAERIPFASC